MTQPTRQLLYAALALATACGLLVVPGAVFRAAAADEVDAPQPRRVVRIELNAARRSGTVSRMALGINHRYTKNGFGLWDAADDRPDPTVVRHMRAAAVSSLRYPGGTTGTMYHWKDAIGPTADRACQVEGHGNRQDGFSAVRDKLAYGPDEFMRVVRASGAKPLIMMPFVTQNPSDAADWVEYMNAPVGTNPRGGVAWARRRAANGHLAPYHVRRWEVGNESHVAPARYRFSSRPRVAVQQYADGGVRNVKRERLGKDCSHPPGGRPSNGKPDQAFEALYTPAKVQRVRVNGRVWRRVRDVERYGSRARVYEVRGTRGRVVFGDGRKRRDGSRTGNGRIPQAGAVVNADYRNDYSGFFRFARQMHKVDRSIQVCATWGKPIFARTAGSRAYDCLSAHPITNFSKKPVHQWRNSLEGHDRMMLGLSRRRDDVRETLTSLPPRTPLKLTEFQPIHGFGKAFPAWSASMSNAIYMTSQWASWLRMGIGWGNGGDLLGRGVGSVFGSPQAYTSSVEAVARRAVKPMFGSGGKVIGSVVHNNPTRRPDLRDAGSYRALTVAATRSRNGDLRLLVVNQLPRQDVQAGVRWNDFRARSKAGARRVVGNRYTNWNPPHQKQTVRLRKTTRHVNRGGFTATFPAHSVSVYHLRRR